MRLGKRQLQELLYYMVLTRRLEEALARLHREQELTTPLALRTRLEAVSVGASFAPTPKDAIASSLPTVGTLLLRGVKPEEIVLQIGQHRVRFTAEDDFSPLGALDKGVQSVPMRLSKALLHKKS